MNRFLEPQCWNRHQDQLAPPKLRDAEVGLELLYSERQEDFASLQART